MTSTKGRLRLVIASGMLVIASGMLAIATACSGTASTPEISGEDLAQRIAAGDAPLLLDVRTPEEFAEGHIPQALNIPYDALAGRIGELGIEDREREIVVYCRSGRRAAEAEETLRRAGYQGVRHLEGDMTAWREAGRPCTGC